MPFDIFDAMRKRLSSFRYAFQGIADVFRAQPNARIHGTVALLVIAAGLYVRLSSMEWVAVVLCIAVVIALEALNTALEHLTNLVSPTHHPLAGKAKDAAAAAVLIAVFGAVIVGLLIFLPKMSAFNTL